MEGEQISSSQLAHLLTQRFHGSSSVEGPMSIADVSRRIASVVQARADARAGKYRPRINTASVQADMDKLHICICGKLAGRHEHYSLVLWEVRSGRNGIKVRIIDPSEPENVVSLTSNLTALGIAPIVTHLDRPCDRWRCGYWCCWALETIFANVDRWQSIEIPPMPDRYEMIVRNIVLQREMQALQRLAERSATRVLGGAGGSSVASNSRRNSVSSIAQAIETLSGGCKGGYLDACSASVCSTSPRHGGHLSPNAMAMMGRGSPRPTDDMTISPRPTDDMTVSPRPYPSDAGTEDGSPIAGSHDGSQDESNESTLPPSPFEGEDRSGASMAPGHLDTSSLQNDTASVQQKSEDGEEPSSPRPEDFRSPSYSPSKATFEAGGMNGMMGMNNPGEAAMGAAMGGMNPMMMSQMMASGMNPMMMQMMMAGMMNGGAGGMGGMPGMGASMMGGSSMGSTATSKTPYDDNMFEKGFNRGNAFDSQYAPSTVGRGGRKFNIWDAYDTAFVPSPMAMMGMGMPNMMQMQMMMNMGAMGNGMGGNNQQ